MYSSDSVKIVKSSRNVAVVDRLTGRIAAQPAKREELCEFLIANGVLATVSRNDAVIQLGGYPDFDKVELLVKEWSQHEK